MSSAGSSARAGQLAEVTKHHIVCRNGGGNGDPHILVGDVEPGSIVRYGVDDDMTCLVVGNFKSEIYVGDGNGGVKTELKQTLLLYGCFCDAFGMPPEPWDVPGRPYEEGRLMTATFGDLDTVAIIMEPGSY